MSIIACLSWYDEAPAMLERCVRSLAKLPVSKLVAVDGAYADYPDAQRESPAIQGITIIDVATSMGISYHVHTPRQIWANEMEKRSHLFAIADDGAKEGDWLLVIDGDETVAQAPPDISTRLATNVFDVADVTIAELHPTGQRRTAPGPRLYRAGLGIHVQGNHCTYITHDGRRLWGNYFTERLEPRISMHDVVINHDHILRHPTRRQAAEDYYTIRDDTVLEDWTCAHCTNQGTGQVPLRWERTGEGPDDYYSTMTYVCDQHRDQLAPRTLQALKDLGHPNAEHVYLAKGWMARDEATA